MEDSGFGDLLTRLVERRGTGVASLSRSCGIAPSDLRLVLEGARPSEVQLRDLAPALGLRTADLFVMAGVTVPQDLTALDPQARTAIPNLLHLMRALPPDQRQRIYQLAAQLPQEPRPPSTCVKPPTVIDRDRGGLGAMLVSMLWINRNVYSRAAQVMHTLTRGQMYLSVSTYIAMGRGRARLRPQWIAHFAAAFGIAVGDLAAITGTDLSDVSVPHDPVGVELAELLWNLRRLSASQADHAYASARGVESARGAVLTSPPARFPRPLAEPAVR